VNEVDARRYPIGRFQRITPPLHERVRADFVHQLERAPQEIVRLVSDLSDSELERTYRPGGWTIRQVVHHVPDSHINAYVRMKLALTEDRPTIKAYMEDRWAELPEAKTGPVDLSLNLLVALHRRWIAMLRALPPEAFLRPFLHPDLGSVSIDQALAIYAWHSRHHTAHIELALGRHAA
jgi:uncharacterized damage-inducible protein DinB